MPDIILNTTFTVPGLPLVPVYGFTDTFNRANAATLGKTSGESKTWDELGGTWNIVDNAAVVNAQTSASPAYPTVDALTGNGTLSTTVRTIGNAGGGLIARYVDNGNLLRLSFRVSSGNNRLMFVSYVGGTATTLGTAPSGSVTADGSVIAIVLNGTSASVTLNGTTVIGPVTVPASTATKHGLYGTTGNGIVYDSISFTPA